MKNKILWLLAGVLLMIPAKAQAAFVAWPGWWVESSEELWRGMKYSPDGEVPRYPISRLFDGDTKTAWVDSAKFHYGESDFNSRYGICLHPDKPVEIDGVRLVNGQNYSAERFKRNDRASRVRVTLENGSKVWTQEFPLKDSMGWQTISFPRQMAESVTLEFVQVLKGTGPGADFCLSELQLSQRGKSLNMRMPKVTIFENGFPGCGSAQAMTANGGNLAELTTALGNEAFWSSDGRYLAGVTGEDYLWVIDTKTQRIIKTVERPMIGGKWQGNRKILVAWETQGKAYQELVRLR